MSEEWGPWIEHDGGPCPVPVGTICHAIYRSPEYDLSLWLKDHPNVIDVGSDWVIAFAIGNSSVWARYVVRYRIRKPRGLTILEELLVNLPERVDA